MVPIAERLLKLQVEEQPHLFSAVRWVALKKMTSILAQLAKLEVWPHQGPKDFRRWHRQRTVRLVVMALPVPQPVAEGEQPSECLT